MNKAKAPKVHFVLLFHLLFGVTTPAHLNQPFEKCTHDFRATSSAMPRPTLVTMDTNTRGALNHHRHRWQERKTNTKTILPKYAMTSLIRRPSAPDHIVNRHLAPAGESSQEKKSLSYNPVSSFRRTATLSSVRTTDSRATVPNQYHKATSSRKNKNAPSEKPVSLESLMMEESCQVLQCYAEICQSRANMLQLLEDQLMQPPPPDKDVEDHHDSIAHRLQRLHEDAEKERGMIDSTMHKFLQTMLTSEGEDNSSSSSPSPVRKICNPQSIRTSAEWERVLANLNRGREGDKKVRMGYVRR